MTRNIDDLIFVDEMGVNCSMRQRYGRSAAETPPRKTITSMKVKTFSYFGTLTFKVLEKAFNSDQFLIFVIDLLEKLRTLNVSNKVIIADNASIHKKGAQ